MAWADEGRLALIGGVGCLESLTQVEEPTAVGSSRSRVDFTFFLRK